MNNIQNILNYIPDFSSLTNLVSQETADKMKDIYCDYCPDLNNPNLHLYFAGAGLTLYCLRNSHRIFQWLLYGSSITGMMLTYFKIPECPSDFYQRHPNMETDFKNNLALSPFSQSSVNPFSSLPSDQCFNDRYASPGYLLHEKFQNSMNEMQNTIDKIRPSEIRLEKTTENFVAALYYIGLQPMCYKKINSFNNEEILSRMIKDGENHPEVNKFFNGQSLEEVAKELNLYELTKNNFDILPKPLQFLIFNSKLDLASGYFNSLGMQSRMYQVQSGHYRIFSKDPLIISEEATEIWESFHKMIEEEYYQIDLESIFFPKTSNNWSN